MSTTTQTHTQRPRCILVGFDFSPLAELALAEAALAARRGADIHAVYVLEPGREPRISHAPGEDLEFETAERIRASAEAALRQAKLGTGVRTFIHVLRGDAAGEILSLAEDVEPELILVGTHGRSGLKRLVLGSVAEKIVRHAGCPVLVMRPERYRAHPEFQPEPPCPECVAVRGATGGADWWCAAHKKPWVRPHRYSYQDGSLHPFHSDGVGPS